MSPERRAATLCVMVVNADPAQLNVLTGLVRKAGLVPRAYPGAEAALAEMSAGVVPALVVTDLCLPGLDGWRFCRLLRSPEYAALNQVPILLVSAVFTGEEPDRIAADLGAEAFLASPVDGERFVEQVNTTLSGRRNRDPLRAQDLLETRTRELRESEEKHRILLEEFPDPIFMLTSEGQYTYANRAFCTAIGKRATDIIGKSISDIFSKAEADARFAILCQVFRTGEAQIVEGRVPRIEGDRYYSTTVTPLKDATGNVVSAICSAKDLTERKQAEETLRDQRWRLASIIEGTHVGTWEWNVQTGETLFDETWAQLAGYTLDELSPTSIETWSALAHPEDLKQSGELLDRHFSGELPYYDCECRIRHKDGTWIWVQDRGRVITRTIDGRPLMMFGTHTDITDRKRAEEERASLEAQLHQAQKMESVGRLAGGVAHDFNNMLGVILGRCEIALDKVDPALSVHRDLLEIRNAAERSAKLTQQLLAFARRQTVTPLVLDLNETIAGMLKMLERLLGEDIQLLWRPDAKPWLVKVDPSQIDQILVNLCVNARDAIADVGKLTIETDNTAFDADYCAIHPGFVPGEYVRLAVSDNGCGMDQRTLGQIFEPFFTTKGVGKGTGLGLATVYGIVKQNQGFINADSEPGQGTTFTIYLPRHASRPERAQPAAPVEDALRGHETILVVEDEPAVLQVTTTMLAEQGYTVLAASTPGEALRLARKHSGELRLLMTDVVMPEVNGRDLATSLLALYPHLRHLFMSGYPNDVIAHHNLLDDGVSFIQKPFSKKDLAAKVREVLDGK
jgi:PAS domain S-box-containing protein